MSLLRLLEKRPAESFRQDRLSQNIQSHVLRFILKCGTTIQGHRPFTLNFIRWFRFLLVASSWSSLASTRLHLPTNHSFLCITFTIVEFLIVGFLRGIAEWRSLQWGSNVQIWVMWLLYAHANDRIVEMLSFAPKTPVSFHNASLIVQSNDPSLVIDSIIVLLHESRRYWPSALADCSRLDKLNEYAELLPVF
jgi:hypothetical protein